MFGSRKGLPAPAALAISVVMHGALLAICVVVPAARIEVEKGEASYQVTIRWSSGAVAEPVVEAPALIVEPPPPPPPSPAPVVAETIETPAPELDVAIDAQESGSLLPILGVEDLVGRVSPASEAPAPASEPTTSAPVLSGVAASVPSSGTSPPSTPSVGQAAPAQGGSTSSVHAPATSSGNAPPRYPAAARRAGQEGLVVVRVALDSSGLVLEASVHATSGHRMLDDAALDAVRTWRFSPATENGVPVPGMLDVPVRFRLSAG